MWRGDTAGRETSASEVLQWAVPGGGASGAEEGEAVRPLIAVLILTFTVPVWAGSGYPTPATPTSTPTPVTMELQRQALLQQETFYVLGAEALAATLALGIWNAVSGDDDDRVGVASPSE